jgi:hypothetical protein
VTVGESASAAEVDAAVGEDAAKAPSGLSSCRWGGGSGGDEGSGSGWDSLPTSLPSLIHQQAMATTIFRRARVLRLMLGETR